MNATHSSGLSRRAFCLCCVASGGFAATSGMSPRQAFAEARGLVSLIKDSAATSPIVTHKLATTSARSRAPAETLPFSRVRMAR